jgi:hypothetical protein
MLKSGRSNGLNFPILYHKKSLLEVQQQPLSHDAPQLTAILVYKHHHNASDRTPNRDNETLLDDVQTQTREIYLTGEWCAHKFLQLKW